MKPREVNETRVRSLKAQGYSEDFIAKRLSVSRTVVRRVLGLIPPSRAKKRETA